MSSSMAVKPEKFPKNTEYLLVSFENKILRRIFTPVRGNGMWRIKHDEELYAEYKDLYRASHIKFKRLRWTGLVQRLPLDLDTQKNSES